jgi:Domain of unknown function (DUF1905)
MKKQRFKAQVLSGHKDHAVEVPFNPAQEWDLEPQPLWRGRRGFSVRATIDGVSFESAIVPRQKRLYLLIDSETARSAAISEGAKVEVVVEPYGG